MSTPIELCLNGDSICTSPDAFIIVKASRPAKISDDGLREVTPAELGEWYGHFKVTSSTMRSLLGEVDSQEELILRRLDDGRSGKIYIREWNSHSLTISFVGVGALE